MEDNPIEVAYTEGYVAGFDERDANTCPYENSTNEENAWFQGWRTARNESFWREVKKIEKASEKKS